MKVSANSTPPSAISEVKTFIENYTKATELPSGAKIERLDLMHNEVWALRQLVDGAAAREQELVDALRAYITFAAGRRQELGSLSPEMEAVDAQARAALSGSAA